MKDYSDSLHKTRYDYEVTTKNTDDIISECDFNNREKLICKDIITHLHRTAIKYINDDKVANIPYIGCLRKNPRIKVISENVDNLTILSKEMNKDEYRSYVGNLVNEVNRKAKQEDIVKLEFIHYKSLNKKLYDRYARAYGVENANKVINTIKSLQVIPFNEEIEEMYRRINNEE